MNYKKVYSKQIYIITKNYTGGRVEYIEAHMNEDDARKATASMIPLKMDNYYYALNAVHLHGEFIEENK